MSLQLLQRIEEAEAKAERIRQEAQQQARNMLKTVEETCATREREAAQRHRGLLRDSLKEAQTKSALKAEKDAAAYAASRDEMVKAANRKLPAAAQFIYERILKNGYR